MRYAAEAGVPNLNLCGNKDATFFPDIVGPRRCAVTRAAPNGFPPTVYLLSGWLQNALDAAVRDRAAGLASDAKTPMYVLIGDALAGIVAVADEVRPSAKEAIARLKQIGVRTAMVTGDNRHTGARSIRR